MKKILTILCTILLFTSAVTLTGCGGSQSEKDIMVISREAGSGTRGAFEEILDIEAEDVYYDLISDKTNNVMTAVAGNKWAIGYISLGSVNDTIKTLKIEGVAPTAENVSNNSYPIARPFLVVHNKDAQLSQIAEDFKLFLSSTQAQAIISEKGYVVTTSEPQSYTAAPGMSGTLSINGSTSVGPLMVSLAAKYIELNSGLSVNDITIEQTGSGSGITAATNNTSDFGMSSRDLKTEEETALEKITICMDGIAVIVNKDNTIENISLSNLKSIYLGDIRKFSEIEN
ncbi:MAG: substrate-binding domain-containing protein [Clostridia bacterium]|nr:substrate-binding domain-containing protein [Clostridia bacterium]